MNKRDREGEREREENEWNKTIFYLFVTVIPGVVGVATASVATRMVGATFRAAGA